MCTALSGVGGAISDVRDETEAIKKGIRMALGMLATIVVSLIAWLGSQLYRYVQRDIAAVRPAVVAQAPRLSDSPRLPLSFQGLS